MAITKKQQEIDKMKWQKSAELGKDACGSFAFCSVCDKSKENPCHKAWNKYNKLAKTQGAKAQPGKKQLTVNGQAVEYRATVVDD